MGESPLIHEGQPLDWAFDPVEALARWPMDRRVLLLHSGRYHPRWSRWSILAQPVGRYVFSDQTPQHWRGDRDTQTRQGRSQWIGSDAGLIDGLRFSHRPFHDLRQLLRLGDGLWIGYLSYDLARWIEKISAPPQNGEWGGSRGCREAIEDRGWPLIQLGYCPGYLVYDGLQRRWWACGTWREDSDHHDTFPPLSVSPPRLGTVEISSPRPTWTRQQYEQAVARGKDHIIAGDVFQINLAQRFTAHLGSGGPDVCRALYDRLAAVSPAWFGAYLEFTKPACSVSGEGGVAHRLLNLKNSRSLGCPDGNASLPRGVEAIASTSPELFLKVEDRLVTTRPIKGTRPTSVDALELRDSPKDTAELHMIVDLMRNDLGRVCDYGSIRVAQPRAIETHPTVHHGVATITGRLHESKDIVDLLRATWPGGSVTGAPKVRAMQLIDAIEPVRRGPYCGCIGYLSRRYACLSIAIRTMLMQSDPPRVDFSVGSGIVADSQPQAEYQETLDKAAAMLSAMRLGQAVNR